MNTSKTKFVALLASLGFLVSGCGELADADASDAADQATSAAMMSSPLDVPGIDDIPHEYLTDKPDLIVSEIRLEPVDGGEPALIYEAPESFTLSEVQPALQNVRADLPDSDWFVVEIVLDPDSFGDIDGVSEDESLEFIGKVHQGYTSTSQVSKTKSKENDGNPLPLPVEPTRDHGHAEGQDNDGNPLPLPVEPTR